MSKLITETVRFDPLGPIMEMVPDSFEQTPYIRLSDARQVAFVVIAGPMEVENTLEVEVLECKHPPATDEQPLVDRSGNAVEIEIESCVDSHEVSIEMAGVAAADTVTINGITFTARIAESIPDREFDQSGTDAECATSLAACVNDATYGVPQVNALDAGDFCFLVSPGYARGITVAVSDDTNTIPESRRSQGIVEIDPSMLSEGYEYVSVMIIAPVANTDDIIVAPQVIRGGLRYAPQRVASDHVAV
jgi:hypothetical protein